MAEVLFLAHRMPFPPDRGDKIRSCHVLRQIASLGPVHVATFAENALDLAEEPQLAALATSYCLVRRSKPLALAGIEALVRGRPVSLTAFHSRTLADYVSSVLRERPIDTIYVFSGQMGQYIPASFTGRVVFDFVDVDSAKFEVYGAERSGPRSWIDAREGSLLRAEEARLARRADLSLLVSAEEAALFASRLSPDDRARCAVRTLRNGIDSTYFDPASSAAELRLEHISGPRLIFTGQMDYAPNIAAARKVIERLMPAMRAAIPETTFHVVGRGAPESLRAFDGRNGCHIWGEVADMRPWLAGADLALVPLELARGVQNKVLEAMAMQLPVVLSPQAATGIGALDGRDLAIGESDDALIAWVLKLVRDVEAARLMGQAARRFVVDNLSWPATLASLQAMLTGDQDSARRAA